MPVVANGVVYTFGAEGQLHAVDLETGKRLWSEDTMRRFKVPKNFFGSAGSPLVEDGRVLANIGGEKAGVVAFDARTGAVLWTATDDPASYSSAAGATINARRYAVFLTRTGLLGLDPATGAVRFQRRWRSRSASSVNVATPIVIDDTIFVSAEYGPGAGVLRVNDGGLTELWTSDEVLSNHYATSVYRDGILYGFHGRQEYGPSLRAVEYLTAKVRWSEEQFRAGSLVLAGDRLLILREGGELVMAAAVSGRLPPDRPCPDSAADGPRVPGAGRWLSVRQERRHADLPGPAPVTGPAGTWAGAWAASSAPGTEADTDPRPGAAMFCIAAAGK